MKDNKKQLENIASKVISKMPSKSKDNENFGFVITILMVISIILTLIRIIQECNKSKYSTFSQNEKYQFFGEQTKSLSIKRSWFTKMTIKKIIRKQIPKEDYRTYGYDLMNSILDTGETLKDDEIITLVEAANV